MTKQKSKNTNLALLFVLSFCLVFLASWLFVPWLLEDGVATSMQKNSSQAVAELMESTLPDHIFFSPRAHSLDECNQCHGFSQDEYLAMFKLEEITDTKDDEMQVFFEARVMSMAECLSCHTIEAHLDMTGAGEACATCHK